MAESKENQESHRIQITVAVIGAIAVILAAIIGILPSLMRDRDAAPVLPTSPVPVMGASSPASMTRTGVALPPEFAGNIHSAKANYGCGFLFGAPNDEPLSICGLMPSLPVEWVSKIRRVDADCEKAASDRIILELWTGENYEGEYWAYTFGC